MQKQEMASRDDHGLAFKAKVTLAAIRGEPTLMELSWQSDALTNQTNSGKTSPLRVPRTLPRQRPGKFPDIPCYRF